MIIAIQLLLFLFVLFLRGNMLFGGHLSNDVTEKHLVYVSKGKHGNITSRHFGLRQNNAIPFVIRPERAYHRFLKAMGISTELHFGDEEFDNRFFITTDFPSHIEQLVHSKALLKHLKELFSLPVKSLHATAGKIWCVIKSEDLKQPDVYFRQHIEILKSISAIISTQRFGEEEAPLRNYKQIMAFTFISLHAALLIFGLSSFFPMAIDTVDTFEWTWLEQRALYAGAGIIMAWLAAILLIFERSSWVCWVLADLLICGVVGILLTSVYLAREGNIHLAQNPAQIMFQEVTGRGCVLKCRQSCGRRCTRQSHYNLNPDTECSAAKRGDTLLRYKLSDNICKSSARYAYTLAVKHWSSPGHYRFESNDRLFDGAKMGKALAIPVHPGAFGAPWVDSSTITKAD